MVSWPHCVPGRLTLGPGAAKPGAGHPPWAHCPGQGGEGGRGSLHVASSDFLAFGHPGLGGEGSRGRGKVFLQVTFAVAKLLWLSSYGCQLSEVRVWAHLFPEVQPLEVGSLSSCCWEGGRAPPRPRTGPWPCAALAAVRLASRAPAPGPWPRSCAPHKGRQRPR
jgi:hypothetical protein